MSATDSSIVIRPAQYCDRQKIIQLETLAVQNLCRCSYSNAEVDRLVAKIPSLRFDDEVIVVAEKDRSLVGFASLLRHRAYLRTLYVRPHFARQKLHLQLLEAIEQEAIKLRIATLRVTSSLSEKAVYDAGGYQEVGCCNLAKMDVLVPGVAMQKNLGLGTYNREKLLSYCKRAIVAAIPNALFWLLAL